MNYLAHPTTSGRSEVVGILEAKLSLFSRASTSSYEGGGRRDMLLANEEAGSIDEGRFHKGREECERSV